eukprot:GAHX01002145.1.p1 GENE.GAHX01002145.1~~GAHX01002145.1.p1  ORF type:complete len:414 (-),score=59.92 GAHX01002145.1:21-1262(-)
MLNYKKKDNHHSSKRQKRAKILKTICFIFSAITLAVWLTILCFKSKVQNKEHNFESSSSLSVYSTSSSSYSSSHSSSSSSPLTQEDNKQLIVQISPEELEISFIKTLPREDIILRLSNIKAYYKTKEYNEKKALLFDKLNPIKPQLVPLFNSYKEWALFFIKFTDIYINDTVCKVKKNFPFVLFKFLKLTKLTFGHVARINELAKTVELDALQKKILGFLTFKNLLKVYYECKVKLKAYTKLFLDITFKGFENDPKKYHKLLKGKVLYKKIINASFQMINFDENSNLDIFKDYLNKIGMNKANLWTLRNYKMASYYLLIESFNLMFYIFEVDYLGNILDTRSWFNCLLEEDNIYFKLDEFEYHLKKLKELSKEMFKLWINNRMKYDLRKILEKYVAITNEGSILEKLFITISN